jgi:hypothetical protein
MCRHRDWSNLSDLMRSCYPELTAEQLSYQVRTKAWSSCLFRLEGRAIAYCMHNIKSGPKTAWFEQSGVHPA